MAERPPAGARLRFEPLTEASWPDLEALFGERGACGGCWCMYWRQSAKEHERNRGAGNRAALREHVRGGRPLGVIGYLGGQPVGWCSVAPREHFVRLARSRILAPVDDAPVWSITCLYLAPGARRQGISSQLVDAACRHAASLGAATVEAYPVEPRSEAMPPPFAWTGIRSAFDRVGFHEVARRAETRPILRRDTRG
ncbi:MAG TPA: GNAT family N-acetyltransferase [Longimicrobiaceae bacterium]|nr:GNAT family N-acetyltransferase [Longimicrobiaceae bacterium]